MINLMKNKGITLIALVITIIVLIILAGVAINLVTGNNGTIEKSQKAANETEIAAGKERAELLAHESSAEYYERKYSNGES